ncbi:PKS-ER domain-containing protein [Mycena kentingensis (nom. inval.)]|nr:PKS-ER domain-containing protein [Mycena kentingensis (nom. inval.)]
MRAVLIKNGSGPLEDLYIGDAPSPVPRADEVLVKIKAFGLNRMDILQRNGNYPPPPGSSNILGVEFSGTVASIGDGVTRWKEGDAVLGLAGGGAYAECIVVPQTHVVAKPSALSWAEAASLPECYLTAFQAVVMYGEIQPGDDVLVHAGASGVGIAAIQLAQLYNSKSITATASTQTKLDFLLNSAGATHVANYQTRNFSEVVLKEATGGKGVDVVVDFVYVSLPLSAMQPAIEVVSGQSHFQKNIDSMALDGRMTMLAFLSGAVVPNVNLAPVLRKRLRIQGSTLRSRTAAYQTELMVRFELEVLPHITGAEGNGKLKTWIHKREVYPWTQIQDAHREMEADANIGKIIAEVV